MGLRNRPTIDTITYLRGLDEVPIIGSVLFAAHDVLEGLAQHEQLQPSLLESAALLLPVRPR